MTGPGSNGNEGWQTPQISKTGTSQSDAVYYDTLYTPFLVWFDFVWFDGISTIVGYLMRDPLYTYILNIYKL